MPRRREPRFPPYPPSPHRKSGQARLRLPGGRELYLGRHGSPESHRRYAEEHSRWQAARQGVPAAPSGSGGNLTVAAVLERFRGHALRHYRHPDGRPTSELANLRDATAPLLRLFGDLPAADFGPLRLKAVRQAMIDAGHTRRSINQRVGRIKRVFRWAASEELVPAAVVEGLRSVGGLQVGRTEAPEAPPVGPVPVELVEALLTSWSVRGRYPVLPAPVAAMVRVQLYAGCRPGEVCGMRPCDLDRDSLRVDGRPVWVYRPERHKNAWRGQGRAVVLGPRAQAAIAPFLDRPPGAYLFSPRDSLAEHRARQRLARRSPVQPSQADRRKAVPKKQPGLRYTRRYYAEVVRRGCLAAGLSHWSPGQLRHTAATLVQHAHGLDAARAYLGHRDSQMTLTYAERDLDTAARVAAAQG
jgi:integrase